jgi:hypothetical protein
MKRLSIFFGIIITLIIGGGITYALSNNSSNHQTQTVVALTNTVSATTTDPVPQGPVPTHISTPESVKALYMSSWVAAAPKYYQHVSDLLDSTEANALVIDIKDATGKVSFLVDDPTVANTKSPENRIHNIVEFINTLHKRNIYIIGRISTFQDPYLAKTKPEWAIHKKSDGSIWKDSKGLPFLDPANADVSTYLTALGLDAYHVGFDEINYDYIRYPSDGNIKDIDYKLTPGNSRADTITAFAKKLHEGLKVEPGLVMSADLFGLTTTETTDMGIGQVFDRMVPYFDYLAPMVYPSHYAPNEYGIKNPAQHPYEIVSKAMAGAKKKMDALNAITTTSSTSTSADTNKISYNKIRPWLQDFSIRGTHYDADKIKLEMKAVYDSGLTSWMMWDPSNKYTIGAYEK